MSGHGSVLIVEDDYVFRDEVAAALREDGWTVRTACSPSEAELLLRTEPVALVLLDLVLGERRDGFEVLDLLRERGSDVPVVVASSYVRRYVRELAAFYPQIRVVISKPCRAAEIVAQLAAVSSGAPA